MTLSILLTLAHAIVLNGTIVPDTFCQGVRMDGTSYKAVIETQAANSSHKDTWSAEVRKGQRVLCGTESPNW